MEHIKYDGSIKDESSKDYIKAKCDELNQDTLVQEVWKFLVDTDLIGALDFMSYFLNSDNSDNSDNAVANIINLARKHGFKKKINKVYIVNKNYWERLTGANETRTLDAYSTREKAIDYIKETAFNFGQYFRQYFGQPTIEIRDDPEHGVYEYKLTSEDGIETMTLFILEMEVK